MIGITNATQKSIVAKITVNYPVGSTCSCSNGIKTYSASDTSGTFVFNIRDFGSWTLSCTDGTRTATETISIDSWGQSQTVTLEYKKKFIDDGQILETFTLSSGTLVSVADYNYATFTTGGNKAAVAYVQVDLTQYSTLHLILADGNKSYATGQSDCPSMGIASSAPTIAASTGVIDSYDAINKFISSSGNYNGGEYALDISSYTGNKYIFLATCGTSSHQGPMNIIDFYAQ